MKDLQVKYTDPLDLIPYENNPRINDYAVKKVMESIKEYGFTNPIIVDADMVIIAGHTRREASILAGLDRVPYIVRDDLTPEQVKAYRIADNKLAELSNWDDELLKKELFELQAVDYSLEVMGFTEIDLKEIFTEKEVPKEKKKKEEKTPVLAYAGLTAQDLTTWSKVGELIVGAVSNPYVLSLVAVSVWNTLNDPTTKGLGDSARAKSYTAPQ